MAHTGIISNELREMINSHHLKPPDKSADDIILEILSDIEDRDYLSASSTIRMYTGFELIMAASCIKKLAKQELNLDILTSLKTLNS